MTFSDGKTPARRTPALPPAAQPGKRPRPAGCPAELERVSLPKRLPPAERQISQNRRPPPVAVPAARATSNLIASGGNVPAGGNEVTCRPRRRHCHRRWAPVLADLPLRRRQAFRQAYPLQLRRTTRRPRAFPGLCRRRKRRRSPRRCFSIRKGHKAPLFCPPFLDIAGALPRLIF